jgi:hypothetical protein
VQFKIKVQRKENCDQISFFLTNGRKKTVTRLLAK